MFHKCTLHTDPTAHLPKVLPEASWHVKLKHRFKQSLLVSIDHPEIFEYFHSRAAVHRESRRQVKQAAKEGFIIHPLSDFRKRWDVFIFFMLFFHQMITPFIVGFFVELNPTLIEFSILADLFSCWMLGIEIILRFRTGFIVEETNEIILSPKIIKWKYLKDFVVDAITSAPFIYIAGLFFEVKGGTISGETVIYMGCLFGFSFYRFSHLLSYCRTIPKMLKLSEKTTLFLALMLRTIYVQVFFSEKLRQLRVTISF